MEHIGKDLGSLKREVNTLGRKIYEPAAMTEEMKREELRKSLGVSSLDHTFDSLKSWPGTEKAVAAFKALASGKTDWKMLLVYGNVGNGKTHLCEAASIALYRRGSFCRVLTMAKMMGVLHECIGSEKRYSLEDMIHNYSYSHALIVDDVDGSEWEYEQLEKIIRVRYHENLFTILTTNRDLDELPERIVSRFRDKEKARLVLNDGEDYRPNK